MSELKSGRQRNHRQRCPFHGFHWPESGSDLIDSGGDECGLDLDHHGACRMETEHQAADFDRCEVARQARNFLQAGRRHIRFFPAELLPESVLFEAWRDRVMRPS
ncbi:MAG TPA: hypothetical protein VG675_04280 [Bryobacteraceae bacterium]|nr:hypothetical protein [Bryobacteraceae bacterium]